MTKKKIWLLIALATIFYVALFIHFFTAPKSEDLTRSHLTVGRAYTVEERNMEIKRLENLQKKDPAIALKTPFNFYAIYIDEEGKPISGIPVHINWHGMKGLTKLTLITDKNGEIHLKNKRGHRISAIPESTDYSPNSNQHIRFFEFFDTFSESYWPPDGSKAAVIVMRKKLPPEPLLVGSFRLDLRKGESHATARFNPYRTSPKAEEDGLIQLTLELPEPPTSRQGYHWSFEMRGHGIEFAPSELYESALAPEEGYSNVIRYEFNEKSDPWRASTGQRMFYFKTSDEKYGFIRTKADIASDETGKAIVDFYYNPSGSRVLEQGIFIRK